MEKLSVNSVSHLKLSWIQNEHLFKTKSAVF